MYIIRQTYFFVAKIIYKLINSVAKPTVKILCKIFTLKNALGKIGIKWKGKIEIYVKKEEENILVNDAHFIYGSMGQAYGK